MGDDALSSGGRVLAGVARCTPDHDPRLTLRTGLRDLSVRVFPDIGLSLFPIRSTNGRGLCLAHHYVVDVMAGALVAVPCCLWASKVTGLRRGTAEDLRPSSTDD